MIYCSLLYVHNSYTMAVKVVIMQGPRVELEG